MADWLDEADRDEEDSASESRKQDAFECDLGKLFPNATGTDELFLGITRLLQRYLPIRKGLLALAGDDQTRYVVTTTWNDGRSRQNLSLWLPGPSSLIAMVAEDGRCYTQEFCELFSGSLFERNLLLDADSQSFVLHPLRTAGTTVGVIGYSSDEPSAFVDAGDRFLRQIAEQLAERIAWRKLLSMNLQKA